jgi:hypothetical protein
VIIREIQYECVFRWREEMCDSFHDSYTCNCNRTEHVGHKLYMDSFSSSAALFDDLHTVTLNCCRTVRPKRKGMLKNFGHKMKLKRGNLKTKVKGNLTAKVWKDK